MLDLSKALSVSETNLVAEFSAYNKLYELNDGIQDSTGKTVFPVPLGIGGNGSPWIVARVKPVVHYCMGGVEIDTNARVQRENGSAISGLFACGRNSHANDG